VREASSRRAVPRGSQSASSGAQNCANLLSTLTHIVRDALVWLLLVHFHSATLTASARSRLAAGFVVGPVSLTHTQSARCACVGNGSYRNTDAIIRALFAPKQCGVSTLRTIFDVR
jgi:hypothetical protein